MSELSKRIFVALLLMCITVSLTAYAQNAETDFEKISKYRIMETDASGNVVIDTAVTRADMVQYVIRALNLDGIKAPTQTENGFSDVSSEHYAYDAIYHAKELGLIHGYGDNNFRPDNQITYAEAVKMLVVTLGYSPVADARGGWQQGYITVANTYGITDGTQSDVNALVSGEDIAIMLENAFSVPLMVQTGFGSFTEYQIMDGNNGTELRTLESDHN